LLEFSVSVTLTLFPAVRGIAAAFADSVYAGITTVNVMFPIELAKLASPL